MKINEAVNACYNETLLLRSKTTAENYHQGMKRLLEFLKDKKIKPTAQIEELSIKHFQEFHSWLINIYKLGTARMYANGARYFMNWLIFNNHLDPTAAELEKIKYASRMLSRKKTERMPKAIDEESIEKIIKTAISISTPPPAKQRDYALVVFLHRTGCRISELLKLNINDLDFENMRARVIGKGDREAFIYFNEDAKAALTGYLRVREYAPSDPLFTRNDRGASKDDQEDNRLTPAGARYIIKRLARAGGLDPAGISPHKFRHAFGIAALREIGRIEVVQDLMRHRNIETTRIYAKVSDTELQESYHEIDQSRKRKSKKYS